MSTDPAVYNFNLYIGPRYVPSDAPTNHGKWDYLSGLTGTIDHLGQATLTATLSAGATTGLSVSAGLSGTGSEWPDQAGVWVGPGASGQSWEYIAYHSEGDSLIRNPQRGMSNGHTAGAPVYFWYPLTMNAGQLNISLEQSDNMSVRQWTAKAVGVRAPSLVLKEGHYLLATYARNSITSYDDNDLGLLFVGIVERVQMAQDWNRQGEWEIEISSIARELQATTIPGMRIGKLDIALEAEADASSSLGAPWKLSMPQKILAEADEIPEIDIVELQNDMSPQYAIDGNPNTLWVSDGWLGNPGLYDNDEGHDAWASIFAYPPPTHLIGSRYLEIIHTDFLDFSWIWVYSKYTYPGGSRGRWYQVSDPNIFQENGLDSTSLPSNEDRLVIAENADIFRQLFPAANPAFLLDASAMIGDLPWLNVELVRRLWWEGGAIFFIHELGEEADRLFHWGDVTYAEIENAWKPVSEGGLGQGTSDTDLPASNFYLDISGIRPGEVFRRVLTQARTTVDTMSFVHDYLHHPGYIIHNDPNRDDCEWFKITLPEMSHVLRDDISASTTTLYVVDAQGNPNVEGISNSGSGAIIVDDDVIEFTGKNFKTGTLTGCTVNAVHKAGAKVYVRWHIPWYSTGNTFYSDPYAKPFQDKIFDMATAAYPIRRMTWGRGWYSNGDERFPFIGNFIWRFSLYPDARDPTSPRHEADYLDLWADSVGYTPAISEPNAEIDFSGSVWDEYNADGFRPRTLLMQMRAMWEEGGGVVTDRPRLNYVTVEVDRDYFDPDTWLSLPSGGMDNYLFVYYVLAKSGLYVSALTAENPGSGASIKRSHGMTDRGSAWQIAADAADYGSSVIDVRLNGTIHIFPNKYLLSSSHSADRTLTTDEIARLEIAIIRPTDMGQIKVAWENPVAQTGGAEIYPEEAPSSGGITEIGPLLADTAGTAATIAINLYKTRRFAYNVFVELTDLDLSVVAGQIHIVNYDFDLRGEIVEKVLLVESVEHEFVEQSARTVVGYREIEKEIP